MRDIGCSQRGTGHDLLVLSTLRGDAKDGYQIVLDVEEDSNDLVHFRHGTLYPILHRLEELGLIRGAWSKVGGCRRKIYALTGGLAWFVLA